MLVTVQWSQPLVLLLCLAADRPRSAGPDEGLARVGLHHEVIVMKKFKMFEEIFCLALQTIQARPSFL